MLLGGQVFQPLVEVGSGFVLLRGVLGDAGLDIAQFLLESGLERGQSLTRTICREIEGFVVACRGILKARVPEKLLGLTLLDVPSLETWAFHHAIPLLLFLHLRNFLL